jgi:hypothetical protein
VYPSGQALVLLAKFAQPGNSVLGATVSSTLPNVRAYAATQGSGYALLLVNIGEADTATPTISLANVPGTSYTATATTYGKEQYDKSQNGIWAGPVANTSVTTSGTTVSVTLPPWSITVLQLN